MGEFVKDTGLLKKTLQEIRTDFENDMKQVFGPEFETGVDSPNGLFISHGSLMLSRLWDLAQEVFSSHDPAQAEGVALDWNSALSGVTRKGNVASRVVAMLYTEGSSVSVPAGSIARRSRGSLDFSLEQSMTVDRSQCDEIILQIGEGFDPTSSYTFEFDFGTITWSPNQSPDLPSLIVAAGGECSYSPDRGYIVTGRGTSVGLLSNPPQDFTALAGKAGTFSCSQYGPETCEVGELDTVVSDIDGWDGVYNYRVATVGSLYETDAALRIRRARTARSLMGSGTDAAIAAHVMNDVEGVSSAIVTSNRGMTEDADGRPGKSFETLVIGGSDQDIAKCIWRHQPSGIQSYGNVSVEIADGEGDGQIISFSRPVPVYLWIQLTYMLYDEETAPTEADIKAAIVKWAEGEFTLGKDVIPGRILSAVYPPNLEGIGPAEVRVGVTSLPSGQEPDHWGTDTISISATQYASVTAARVFVMQPPETN